MNWRRLLITLVWPFAATGVAVVLVAAGVESIALPFGFLAVVLLGLPVSARSAVPTWPQSWQGRAQAAWLVLAAGCVYLVPAALATGGCVAGVSAVEDRRDAAEVARYRRELDRLVSSGAGVDAVREWATDSGLPFAAVPAAELYDPPAVPPPEVAVQGSSMVWGRGYMGGRRVAITYYFRVDGTLARYTLCTSRPSL